MLVACRLAKVYPRLRRIMEGSGRARNKRMRQGRINHPKNPLVKARGLLDPRGGRMGSATGGRGHDCGCARQPGLLSRRRTIPGADHPPRRRRAPFAGRCGRSPATASCSGTPSAAGGGAGDDDERPTRHASEVKAAEPGPRQRSRLHAAQREGRSQRPGHDRHGDRADGHCA